MAELKKNESVRVLVETALLERDAPNTKYKRVWYAEQNSAELAE